jgi:hypothetical protein
MVSATRSLGVKVINAGAAAAFKRNARSFSLDDEVPAYGVSSRRIVEALQEAVETLGIPHPLHVHCNNLGEPGNAATAIATMEAARGRPIPFPYAFGYGMKPSAASRRRRCRRVNRRLLPSMSAGDVRPDRHGLWMYASSPRDQARNGSSDGEASAAASYLSTERVSIMRTVGGGPGFLPGRFRRVFFHRPPNGAHFRPIPKSFPVDGP